jgi:hypothetical protein
MYLKGGINILDSEYACISLLTMNLWCFVFTQDTEKEERERER